VFKIAAFPIYYVFGAVIPAPIPTNLLSVNLRMNLKVYFNKSVGLLAVKSVTPPKNPQYRISSAFCGNL
jgi:hypothetical protein